MFSFFFFFRLQVGRKIGVSNIRKVTFPSEKKSALGLVGPERRRTNEKKGTCLFSLLVYWRDYLC